MALCQATGSNTGVLVDEHKSKARLAHEVRRETSARCVVSARQYALRCAWVTHTTYRKPWATRHTRHAYRPS